jgi:hypothetical protein
LCRRCWDLENGQCPQCKWMPDGLPGALRALASTHPQSRRQVAGQTHR